MLGNTILECEEEKYTQMKMRQQIYPAKKKYIGNCRVKFRGRKWFSRPVPLSGSEDRLSGLPEFATCTYYAYLLLCIVLYSLFYSCLLSTIVYLHIYVVCWIGIIPLLFIDLITSIIPLVSLRFI